jgi:amidase
LHWWSAHDLAAAIRDRTVSSVEVVASHLDRIEAIDDDINALVFRIPRSDALALARAADRAVAARSPLGPLHGLPTAVKDLLDVAGMPTTHGAVPYRHNLATADSLLAQRLRRAGAIIVGKTNTPEFGLGTLTFSRLFPPVRNPWNLGRHAGGSSGGAAAAVAAGMLPIADGSDSGGSIRYPAAFTNIVGLRPSPGRVPSGRKGDGWDPHGVLGPLARSARDAGLLLAALAGRDDRAPLALDTDPSVFAGVRSSSLHGLRVAWSRTGGGLPVDPAVLAALDAARTIFEQHGAVVEDVEPDFLAAADDCWQTIEMLGFLAACGAAVTDHGDDLGPDLVRNVAEGRALTADRIVAALAQRTEVFRATGRLLARYDLLALPAVPVPPPPISEEWVREIDGVRLERYFLWQRLACRITVTAHPAVSVPGGFTDEGLPVGLQLVGRHRDELTLLCHAAAYEAAAGWGERRPPL